MVVESCIHFLAGVLLCACFWQSLRSSQCSVLAQQQKMCRYTSECIQTVVEGLGKAMAHGYAWVCVGCWHGWVCVSRVSVSTVSVAGNSKANEYQDSTLNGSCMHHAQTMGGIKALRLM